MMWRFIKGLFRKFPMPEDTTKIHTKLRELNGGEIDGDWVSADGNHALTKLVMGTGGLDFHAASGIPLKSFVNKQTGEVKTYLASHFETA